jgi:hypothetical protein
MMQSSQFSVSLKQQSTRGKLFAIVQMRMHGEYRRQIAEEKIRFQYNKVIA